MGTGVRMPSLAFKCFLVYNLAVHVTLIYIPAHGAGGGLAYTLIVQKLQWFTNAIIAQNTTIGTIAICDLLRWT